jgi:hypothetical protein
MDSPPAWTLMGDGEGGRLMTGGDGEACTMEGEEMVVIVDGEDERDAETEDDDNDTDDNAVEVSLLDGMGESLMFTGSWSEFKGGEAGVEQVAMSGDSELAGGIGELDEGSERAMYVLCRKDLSTFSGDGDDSVCCSCVSELDSAEGVGEGGVA